MLYRIDIRWVILFLTYRERYPEGLVTLPFSVQSQGGMIIFVVLRDHRETVASCQIFFVIIR